MCVSVYIQYTPTLLWYRVIDDGEAESIPPLLNESYE